MKKSLNILLVGVGGQGTILASKVLTRVALEQGYDVKMSEIHGMAQRGGSVVTHVRLGDKVYSPLIEIKQADYIIAFEALEALRWAHFLKPEGCLIVNDQQIEPMSVITGQSKYPDDVIKALELAVKDVKVLTALDIAKQLGNVRTVNIILLGALAKRLEFPMNIWQVAIEEIVKPKYVAVNKKAFALGYEG